MLLKLRGRAGMLATCAALAALTAGCGADDPPGAADARAAQRSAGQTLYWTGTSFAGLPLNAILRDEGRVTFAYGTCRAASDQGCAVPLQIQSTSICDLNVLRFHAPPRSSRPTRGIVVRDYGEDEQQLATGTTTVLVFAKDKLARRAVAALRAVDSPPAERLPRERYPRTYVAELRHVRDARMRLGSVRAVRDQLGISQRAVRVRLALARELGERRLRRPASEFGGRPCAVEPAAGTASSSG